MVKIKVKQRPSSVEGKAGTIYYYVSHRSVVRHQHKNPSHARSLRRRITMHPFRRNSPRQAAEPHRQRHGGIVAHRP